MEQPTFQTKYEHIFFSTDWTTNCCIIVRQKVQAQSFTTFHFNILIAENGLCGLHSILMNEIAKNVDNVDMNFT